MTVMVIRDTGYSCPGKTAGWASLTLQVDQGGRGGQQRGGALTQPLGMVAERQGCAHE